MSVDWRVITPQGRAGAAATGFMLPIYLRILDPDVDDLIVGMMFHVTISSAIGALGARPSAPGLVIGAAPFAVVGGLLGAAAAAVVYDIVGAFSFPLDGTSKPISATWSARLFARLAVTILASPARRSAPATMRRQLSRYP